MLDQVRFNQPSVVRGVAIQRRDSFEQWVTSYSVLYSTNCLDVVYVTDNNGDHAVSIRIIEKYLFIYQYDTFYTRTSTHIHAPGRPPIPMGTRLSPRTPTYPLTRYSDICKHKHTRCSYI